MKYLIIADCGMMWVGSRSQLVDWFNETYETDVFKKKMTIAKIEELAQQFDDSLYIMGQSELKEEGENDNDKNY